MGGDHPKRVWRSLGDSFVLRRLDEPWNKDKESLIGSLLEALSGSGCSEADLTLNLRYLEIAKPQGDELVSRLKELTKTIARSDETRSHVDKLLKLVQLQTRNSESAALLLGQLAEVAHDTETGKRLYSAYQEAMENATPDNRQTVRRKLAGAGVKHVLCRDLVDDLLPWSNDEANGRALQFWLKDVAPALGDELLQEVASRMRTLPGQTDRLALAKAFLPKPANRIGRAHV